MDKDIVVVYGSDWTGLYVDGVCKAQGHSLSVRDIVEAFGFGLVTKSANEEWLDSEGTFPDKLEDVKFS